MEVVLTEDVVGLGDIGEKVKVRPGYARNFLVPRGLAVEIGTTGAKEAAHRMRLLEAKRKRLQGDAQTLGSRLESSELKLAIRVGKGGRVFGSVTARDLAVKLTELGFDIDRRRIQLAEPLKRVGEHKVKVKLHPEVFAELKVTIEALEATKDQEMQEVDFAKQAIEKAVSEKDSENNN